MRRPSRLKRLDQAFGFHEDERLQQGHGNAVRAAYIAMALVTVRFGAHVQYGWQPRYALWAPTALLAVSLVVLAVRRVQLNGFGAPDERLNRMRQSVFAWPCLVLVLGMWALSMHEALVQGNRLALVAFPMYPLIGMAAVLLTRAWNGTMQGNARYWLLNALFMFGLVGWNIWTMKPGALNSVASAALVGLFVFGVCCLLIAWRRWQEQRNA